MWPFKKKTPAESGGIEIEPPDLEAFCEGIEGEDAKAQALIDALPTDEELAEHLARQLAYIYGREKQKPSPLKLFR